MAKLVIEAAELSDIASTIALIAEQVEEGNFTAIEGIDGVTWNLED